VSRLSDWLGSELTILEDLPDFSIVIIICLMTAVVTEVSSLQGHDS
jgi:di/tricarboxylate transporter